MKDFHLTVLAWNAYVANSDANVVLSLTAWLEDYPQLDALALSEVASHADALTRWAKRHGFKLLQETPAPGRPRGDDTGDCALLLAPHVRLRWRRVARMRRWWRVVSRHRWHRPHAYEVAAITVRGQRWRVRSSHWPTLGADGPNAAAWLESARRSRRWLLRGLLRPSVDVGDLNEHADVLADWYGRRFKVVGRGIDVAVTRRVAGGTATEVGTGGSNHHGKVFQLVMATVATPADRSSGN